MDLARLIGTIAYTILLLYVLLLLVRLVFEYIPMFNRSWRPRGFLLVVAEIVYTVTDPPIKLLRRFIPPLRLGVVAIDLAFPLTMLACFVLMSFARALMFVG